jgi:pimeloyl-ACP methyl ester carboxylesterase
MQAPDATDGTGGTGETDERVPLRHVEIHGHRMAYREAGRGSPLLLVHGLAGSSRTWREVLPALAQRHRVVAPDLFGHGASAGTPTDYSLGAHATALRDLVVALDVERATVVGQSLGGGVAMQLAYQHPETVERLVLVSSGGLGREVSWLLRCFAVPGVELFMPVLFHRFVRDRGNAVARFLGDRGVRAPNVEEMWRAFASLSDGPRRAAFVRTLRSVIDLGGQSVSARDRLYLAARVPTLVMWGDRDPILPLTHGLEAHDAIPGSRLEVFPGVGHFPHVERPERFVEVLVDFVDSTTAAATRAADFRALLRPPGEAVP